MHRIRHIFFSLCFMLLISQLHFYSFPFCVEIPPCQFCTVVFQTYWHAPMLFIILLPSLFVNVSPSYSFIYLFIFFICLRTHLSNSHSMYVHVQLFSTRNGKVQVQHGTVAKAELCVRCLNPCACFTSHSGTHESKKEISGGSGFGISNRKNYRSKLAKGGILVDLGRNRIIITVIHFYWILTLKTNVHMLLSLTGT